MRRFLAPAMLAMAFAMSLAAPSMAQQPAFDFDIHAAPVAVPDLLFTGADGTQRSLEDFRGRYVLLNVWATWCAPCRVEMPTLDALQRELGGPGFEVIALSTDTGRRPAVDRLFDEVGIEYLDPVIDDTGAAMLDLGIYALPATLLIDPDGREVGRKIGPAEWDSPEAVAFFRNLVPG